MKIAVIGSGISGLFAAHRLDAEHDVTLFESEERLGGHTHTVEVDVEGASHCVDVGFIVYNLATYPHFIEMIEKLDVETKPTTMSFGISCEKTGLEWASRGARSVFAQPRNLARPRFLKMLLDVRRFNRDSRQILSGSDPGLSLGAYLQENGFSREFVDHYIVPLGAAIWSADPRQFLDFPAATFVRFFDNHGLLQAQPDLPWRVIQGGSQRYVDRLLADFRGALRVGTPIQSVQRNPDHVAVKTAEGPETFDHIVIATHSDQALALLSDPSPAEKEVLGAIRYQPNDVVLHSDTSLMPASPHAWACWNYRIPQEDQSRALLTYDMNRLQGIQSSKPLLVTLNDEGRIDPEQVFGRFVLDHPVFDQKALRAQRQHETLNGVQRTHYAGAYWGYGFHEDGVRSAIAACDSISRMTS